MRESRCWGGEQGWARGFVALTLSSKGHKTWTLNCSDHSNSLNWHLSLTDHTDLSRNTQARVTYCITYRVICISFGGTYLPALAENQSNPGLPWLLLPGQFLQPRKMGRTRSYQIPLGATISVNMSLAS